MSRHERIVLVFLLFFDKMVASNVEEGEEVNTKIMEMAELYRDGRLINLRQMALMQFALNRMVQYCQGMSVDKEFYYNIILFWLDDLYYATNQEERKEFVEQFIDMLNESGYIKKLGGRTDAEITFAQTQETYANLRQIVEETL